jgi:hypothetical protein
MSGLSTILVKRPGVPQAANAVIISPTFRFSYPHKVAHGYPVATEMLDYGYVIITSSWSGFVNNRVQIPSLVVLVLETRSHFPVGEGGRDKGAS